MLSGLWSKSAEPPEGTTGSDHWVAAAYLTGIKPRKTAGSDATVGSATIDQLIAQKIGQETLLPSLQLAVEDPNSSSSNCGEGYSCSYTNSISWIELPTPPEENGAAHQPAADGAEPAGRLRAPVRQRLDAGSARAADEAEPEHPRLARQRAREPAPAARAGRRAHGQPVHRRDSRDRAPHPAGRQGLERRARARPAARHSGAVRRARPPALGAAGARVQGRHHARRDAARRARPDEPRLSVPEERAVPGRRHQRELPRRLAPPGRSGADSPLRRAEPLSRVDDGLSGREAEVESRTATARCSTTR